MVNNRMIAYTVEIDAGHHWIIAPDGAVVHGVPRSRIVTLVADGFMEDETDVIGLNMTLNLHGVIRPGSRLVLAEPATE